jgi:cytochrome c oxidase subunit 2
VTANEIHIPVGMPVLVKLKSADVIHAFWVPMLAGKTQMIPGLTNRQWIEADVAGVYRGQCMQYCGVQHAHMGLEIVAQSQDEFRTWQEAQLRPAATSSATDITAGKGLFMDNCAGCHTVRGTEAVGAHAPDLTHLQSRRLIAAGSLTNTPEHLVQWITHAQELKPGARMPSFTLSDTEISALSAFLSTLD